MAKWKDAESLVALAAALAAAGKYAEAITWQEAALLIPTYRKRSGADGEQRLRLYRAGQPYRCAPTAAIQAYPFTS